MGNRFVDTVPTMCDLEALKTKKIALWSEESCLVGLCGERESQDRKDNDWNAGPALGL